MFTWDLGHPQLTSPTPWMITVFNENPLTSVLAFYSPMLFPGLYTSQISYQRPTKLWAWSEGLFRIEWQDDMVHRPILNWKLANQTIKILALTTANSPTSLMVPIKVGSGCWRTSSLLGAYLANWSHGWSMNHHWITSRWSQWVVHLHTLSEREQGIGSGSSNRRTWIRFNP